MTITITITAIAAARSIPVSKDIIVILRSKSIVSVIALNSQIIVNAHAHPAHQRTLLNAEIWCDHCTAIACSTRIPKIAGPLLVTRSVRVPGGAFWKFTATSCRESGAAAAAKSGVSGPITARLP